jgi:hypothetical protein
MKWSNRIRRRAQGREEKGGKRDQCHKLKCATTSSYAPVWRAHSVTPNSDKRQHTAESREQGIGNREQRAESIEPRVEAESGGEGDGHQESNLNLFAT